MPRSLPPTFSSTINKTAVRNNRFTATRQLQNTQNISKNRVRMHLKSAFNAKGIDLKARIQESLKPSENDDFELFSQSYKAILPVSEKSNDSSAAETLSQLSSLIETDEPCEKNNTHLLFNEGASLSLAEAFRIDNAVLIDQDNQIIEIEDDEDEYFDEASEIEDDDGFFSVDGEFSVDESSQYDAVIEIEDDEDFYKEENTDASRLDQGINEDSLFDGNPRQKDNYLYEAGKPFPNTARKIFNDLKLTDSDPADFEKRFEAIEVETVTGQSPPKPLTQPLTTHPLALFLNPTGPRIRRQEKEIRAHFFPVQRAAEKYAFEKSLKKLEKKPKQYKKLDPHAFNKLEQVIHELNSYNKIYSKKTWKLVADPSSLDESNAYAGLEPQLRLEKVPVSAIPSKKISHGDYKSFLKAAGADVTKTHLGNLQHAAYEGLVEAYTTLPQRIATTTVTTGISKAILQVAPVTWASATKNTVRTAIRPERVFVGEMVKRSTTYPARRGLARHAQVKLPTTRIQAIATALEPIVHTFAEEIKKEWEKQQSLETAAPSPTISPTQRDEIKNSLEQLIKAELEAHYAAQNPDSDIYQSDERKKQTDALLLTIVASSMAETVVYIVGSNVLTAINPLLNLATPGISLLTRPAAAALRQGVANWYDTKIIASEALAYYHRLEKKDKETQAKAENRKAFDPDKAKTARLEAVCKYVQDCFLSAEEADRLHRLERFEDRKKEYELDLKALTNEIEADTVLLNLLKKIPSEDELKKVKVTQKENNAPLTAITYQKYHLANQIFAAQQALDKLNLTIYKTQDQAEFADYRYLEKAQFIYTQALKIYKPYASAPEAHLKIKEFVTHNAGYLLLLQTSADEKSQALFKTIQTILGQINNQSFSDDLKQKNSKLTQHDKLDQTALIQQWLINHYQTTVEILEQKTKNIHERIEKERQENSLIQLDAQLIPEKPVFLSKEERFIIDYHRYLQLNLHHLHSKQEVEAYLLQGKNLLEQSPYRLNDQAHLDPTQLLEDLKHFIKNASVLEQKRIEKKPIKTNPNVNETSFIKALKTLGENAKETLIAPLNRHKNIASANIEATTSIKALSLDPSQQLKTLAAAKTTLLEKREKALIERYKTQQHAQAYNEDLKNLDPSKADGAITVGGELYRNIASRSRETKEAQQRRRRVKNLKKIFRQNKNQIAKNIMLQTGTQAASVLARSGYQKLSIQIQTLRVLQKLNSDLKGLPHSEKNTPTPKTATGSETLPDALAALKQRSLNQPNQASLSTTAHEDRKAAVDKKVTALFSRDKNGNNSALQKDVDKANSEVEETNTNAFAPIERNTDELESTKAEDTNNSEIDDVNIEDLEDSDDETSSPPSRVTPPKVGHYIGTTPSTSARTNRDNETWQQWQTEFDSTQSSWRLNSTNLSNLEALFYIKNERYPKPKLQELSNFDDRKKAFNQVFDKATALSTNATTPYCSLIQTLAQQIRYLAPEDQLEAWKKIFKAYAALPDNYKEYRTIVALTRVLKCQPAGDDRNAAFKNLIAQLRLIREKGDQNHASRVDNIDIAINTLSSKMHYLDEANRKSIQQELLAEYDCLPYASRQRINKQRLTDDSTNSLPTMTWAEWQEEFNQTQAGILPNATKIYRLEKALYEGELSLDKLALSDRQAAFDKAFNTAQTLYTEGIALAKTSYSSITQTLARQIKHLAPEQQKAAADKVFERFKNLEATYKEYRMIVTLAKYIERQPAELRRQVFEELITQLRLIRENGDQNYASRVAGIDMAINALSSKLSLLPPADREAIQQKLLAEFNLLPLDKQNSETRLLLTDSQNLDLKGLPRQTAKTIFNSTLDRLRHADEKTRVDGLRHLCGQMQHLDLEDREEAWNALFTASKQIQNPGQKIKIWIYLAHAIEKNSQPGSSFKKLLEAATDPSLKNEGGMGTVIEILSVKLADLDSDDNKDASDQIIGWGINTAWNKLFEAFQGLPDSEQNSNTPTILAYYLKNITSSAQRASAFKKILEQITRPPLKNKPGIDTVLETLSFQLPYLDLTDKKDASDQIVGWGVHTAWNKILEAFQTLPEGEEDSTTLANLAFFIQYFQNSKQQSSAFKKLLEVTQSHKNQSGIADVIDELWGQIPFLDLVDEKDSAGKTIGWGKEAAWHRLLAVVVQRPDSAERNKLLVSLIAQISALPTEGAQKTAFLTLKTHINATLFLDKKNASSLYIQLITDFFKVSTSFTAQEFHENLAWIRSLATSLPADDQNRMQLEIAKQLAEHADHIGSEKLFDELNNWWDEIIKNNGDLRCLSQPLRTAFGKLDVLDLTSSSKACALLKRLRTLNEADLTRLFSESSGLQGPALVKKIETTFNNYLVWISGQIAKQTDHTQRLQIFSNILSTIDEKNPPEKLTAILSNLALNISELRIEDRTAQWHAILDKFKSLHSTPDQLDKHVLITLSEQIKNLPKDKKFKAYHEILTIIQKWRPFVDKNYVAQQDTSEILISILSQIKTEDLEVNQQEAILQLTRQAYAKLHHNKDLVLAYKRGELLAAIATATDKAINNTKAYEIEIANKEKKGTEKKIELTAVKVLAEVKIKTLYTWVEAAKKELGARGEDTSALSEERVTNLTGKSTSYVVVDPESLRHDLGLFAGKQALSAALSNTLEKLEISATDPSIKAWISYKDLLKKLKGLSEEELNSLELPHSPGLKGRELIKKLETPFDDYLFWLSGQISQQSNAAQRLEIFKNILTEIDWENPPENVSHILNNLALSLKDLPAEHQTDQWNVLLHKTVHLPLNRQDDQALKTLTILSEQIKDLPQQRLQSLHNMFHYLEHSPNFGGKKDISETLIVLTAQIATEDFPEHEREIALGRIKNIYTQLHHSNSLYLKQQRSTILTAIATVAGEKITNKKGESIAVLSEQKREEFFKWVYQNAGELQARKEDVSTTLLALSNFEIKDTQKKVAEQVIQPPQIIKKPVDKPIPINEKDPIALAIYIINEAKRGQLGKTFNHIRDRITAFSPADQALLLTLLAQQTPYLAEVDQLKKWQAVFLTAQTLKDTERNTVLQALTVQISSIFPIENRRLAYDQLLGFIQTALNQNKPVSLGHTLPTLALTLKTLQLGPTEFWQKWKSIRDIVDNKIYQGETSLTVAYLADYIGKITKSTDKGEAFGYLSKIINDRIHKEDMTLAIVALSTSINFLAEDEKNERLVDRANAWKNPNFSNPKPHTWSGPGIWDLVGKLKPDQQNSVLNLLSMRLDTLPKKLRATAFTHIAAAVQMCIEEGQEVGDTVTILASKIHLLRRTLGTQEKGKAWAQVWQAINHPRYTGNHDEGATWLAMQLNELPAKTLKDANGNIVIAGQDEAFRLIHSKLPSVTDINYRRIILSCLASSVNNDIHGVSADERNQIKKEIWNALIKLKAHQTAAHATPSNPSDDIALKQLSPNGRKEFLKLFLNREEAPNIETWQPNWYLSKIRPSETARIEDYINPQHPVYTSGINHIKEVLIDQVKNLPPAQQADAVKRLASAIAQNLFSDDRTINAALYGLLVREIGGLGISDEEKSLLFDQQLNAANKFISKELPASLEEAANRSFVLSCFIAQIDKLSKDDRKTKIQSILKYLPGLYYAADLKELLEKQGPESLDDKIKTILSKKGLNEPKKDKAAAIAAGAAAAGAAAASGGPLLATAAAVGGGIAASKAVDRMQDQYAVQYHKLYSAYTCIKILEKLEASLAENKFSNIAAEFDQYKNLDGNLLLTSEVLPTLARLFQKEFGIQFNQDPAEISYKRFEQEVNLFDTYTSQKEFIHSYGTLIRSIKRIPSNSDKIKAIKHAINLLRKIDDTDNQLRLTLALSLIDEIAHLPPEIRLQAFETILDEALPYTKTEIPYTQISESNSKKNHKSYLISYHYLKEKLLSRDSNNIIRRKDALEFLFGVAQRVPFLRLDAGETKNAKDITKTLWTDTDNRSADIDPSRKLYDRLGGSALDIYKSAYSFLVSAGVEAIGGMAGGPAGAIAADYASSYAMDMLLDYAFKEAEERLAQEDNRQMQDGESPKENVEQIEGRHSDKEINQYDSSASEDEAPTDSSNNKAASQPPRIVKRSAKSRPRSKSYTPRTKPRHFSLPLSKSKSIANIDIQRIRSKDQQTPPRFLEDVRNKSKPAVISSAEGKTRAPTPIDKVTLSKAEKFILTLSPNHFFDPVQNDVKNIRGQQAFQIGMQQSSSKELTSTLELLGFDETMDFNELAKAYKATFTGSSPKITQYGLPEKHVLTLKGAVWRFLENKKPSKIHEAIYGTPFERRLGSIFSTRIPEQFKKFPYQYEIDQSFFLDKVNKTTTAKGKCAAFNAMVAKLAYEQKTNGKKFLSSLNELSKQLSSPTVAEGKKGEGYKQLLNNIYEEAPPHLTQSSNALWEKMARGDDIANLQKEAAPFKIVGKQDFVNEIDSRLSNNNHQIQALNISTGLHSLSILKHYTEDGRPIYLICDPNKGVFGTTNKQEFLNSVKTYIDNPEFQQYFPNRQGKFVENFLIDEYKPAELDKSFSSTNGLSNSAQSASTLSATGKANSDANAPSTSPATSTLAAAGTSNSNANAPTTSLFGLQYYTDAQIAEHTLELSKISGILGIQQASVQASKLSELKTRLKKVVPKDTAYIDAASFNELYKKYASDISQEWAFAKIQSRKQVSTKSIQSNKDQQTDDAIKEMTTNDTSEQRIELAKVHLVDDPAIINSTSRDIMGTHNLNNFEGKINRINDPSAQDRAEIENAGIVIGSAKILSKDPDSNIQGVYDIKYEYKYYKAVLVKGMRQYDMSKEYTHTGVKTVYDPTKIPDDEMLNLGKKGYDQLLQSHPLKSLNNISHIDANDLVYHEMDVTVNWQGKSLLLRFYRNNLGQIGSFFPLKT